MLQIVNDIYTVSLSLPVMAGRRRRNRRGVKGGWGVIIKEKEGGREGRDRGIAVHPRGILCD